MKSIKINLKAPEKEVVESIAAELRRGKVLAYPTDTIYGLGCLVSDKAAMRRIRKIKGRDQDKPMLVLVASFSMLKDYFHVDHRQMAYLKRVWPGKVSVILKQKGRFGKELLGSAEDAAVRLPKSVFLVKMIKRAGEPIVSTSLNLSGQGPIEDPSKIAEVFGKNGPDVVADIGRKLIGRPSRLVDLRDMENVKVIRK